MVQLLREHIALPEAGIQFSAHLSVVIYISSSRGIQLLWPLWATALMSTDPHTDTDRYTLTHGRHVHIYTLTHAHMCAGMYTHTCRHTYLHADTHNCMQTHSYIEKPLLQKIVSLPLSLLLLLLFPLLLVP